MCLCSFHPGGGHFYQKTAFLRSAVELTLVLGGLSSGKTALALSLAQRFIPPRVYIGTAEPIDEEMAQKIAQHRAERDESWQTVEAPLELGRALRESDKKEISLILVDGLGVWVGNLFAKKIDYQKYIIEFLDTLSFVETPLIIVSEEVGLGGISPSPEVRRWGEALGKLNQALAERAKRVALVVAGFPLWLKGGDYEPS
ncbi:MAG TPA: bifunctional adenosylcobinamide kinase/adenosylcobinamide-phosphate guanylyltransferase [Thermodesulfatator sp.]|nr:bifunctional adenosylcobinamide kinase/adenosylcobinamide-phosphate guanylyltransferase [Thermodesulfatator sp.]